jgi:hypothetical protein
MDGGGVSDLIIVGDEAYTLDEVRDAMQNPRCPHHCHGYGHPILTESEKAIIRREYRRKHHTDSNAVELAQRFGVSPRTINRVVRAAA